MVSAFRAMPSLVAIKRGPGLVLDWSQAAGAFAIGGDSRDIVIWDASSETKLDVRIRFTCMWDGFCFLTMTHRQSRHNRIVR